MSNEDTYTLESREDGSGSVMVIADSMQKLKSESKEYGYSGFILKNGEFTGEALL